MFKRVFIATTVVTLLTAASTGIGLTLLTGTSNNVALSATARTSTKHVRVVNATKLVSVAKPIVLIGLPNRHAAKKVTRHYGNIVLWAFDKKVNTYRPLTSFKAPSKSAVYTTLRAANVVLGPVMTRSLVHRPIRVVVRVPIGSLRSAVASKLTRRPFRTVWNQPVSHPVSQPETPTSISTSYSSPISSAATSPTPAGAPAVQQSSMPALSLPGGQTLFDDQFSGSSLDTSNWNSFLTSRAASGWPWNSNNAGGSSSANPSVNNDLEYNLPSGVAMSSGGLKLTATRATTQGVLGTSPYTYPWASGAVSSYNHFEFDGGTLQVLAKMPSGDGMWPGLWMLPGPGGNAGDDAEIDMFEGGFTSNGDNVNDNYAWHMHSSTGWVGGVVNTGIDLTAGYHVYGLNWVPGQSMTWYFDGKQIAHITSADANIPNEPMELILTLQVAADSTSGWHTLVDGSTPSSASMYVREVKVTS